MSFFYFFAGSGSFQRSRSAASLSATARVQVVSQRSARCDLCHTSTLDVRCPSSSWDLPLVGPIRRISPSLDPSFLRWTLCVRCFVLVLELDPRPRVGPRSRSWTVPVYVLWIHAFVKCSAFVKLRLRVAFFLSSLLDPVRPLQAAAPFPSLSWTPSSGCHSGTFQAHLREFTASFFTPIKFGLLSRQRKKKYFSCVYLIIM